jgi:preprotein translocase subunit SecY
MARKPLPAVNKKGLTELWARLRFLLLAIVVYRLGTHIPLPGIDPDRVASLARCTQARPPHFRDAASGEG